MASSFSVGSLASCLNERHLSPASELWAIFLLGCLHTFSPVRTPLPLLSWNSIIKKLPRSPSDQALSGSFNAFNNHFGILRRTSINPKPGLNPHLQHLGAFTLRNLVLLLCKCHHLFRRT